MSHCILPYLVGLALGYWVLTHAEREKAILKTIGKVIGWVIIVASVLCPLGRAGSALLCHNHGMACSYSSNCPWSGHMMGKDGQCMGMPGDKDAKEDDEKTK